MPPRWSVGDSEDEDEQVSPAKPERPHVQAAVASGGSAHGSADQRSTDSTDTLLRNAHRDLMASTMDVTTQANANGMGSDRMAAGDRSAVSPDVSRKRRKTLDETPVPVKKVKTSSRSQSIQSTKPSTSSSAVQYPVQDEVVLPPTGDTIRVGTLEQEALVEQALRKPEASSMQNAQQQDITPRTSLLDNDSSPVPWSVNTPASKDKSTQPARTQNSDEEQHIVATSGLPKEQYKPRPSRSRSEQMADEPADWSVRPEKKAKNKRNQTIDHVVGSEQRSPVMLKLSKPSQTSQPASNHGDDERDMMDNSISATHNGIDRSTQQSGSANVVVDSASVPSEPGADAISQSSHHSAVEVRIPIVRIHDSDKTNMPPPLSTSKKLKKSRRSHTTIFEDHTGFEATQSSPNLRQMQATRKQNVKKDNKKAKKAGEDDDWDVPMSSQEDELAKPSTKSQEPEKDGVTEEVVTAAEVPESAPTSETPVIPQPRKRGRPRKTPLPAATQIPAQPEVIPQAQKENDGTSVIEVEQSTSDTATTTADTTVAETAELSSTPPNKDKSVCDTDAMGALAEKGLAKKQQHTPIKTQKNIFRVGLSKRQRIQPLLRIVRK